MKSSDLIKEFILHKAQELGIDAIGFGNASLFDELQKKYYPEQNNLLSNFITEPKTIICAALSYRYEWNLISSKSNGYIARYTSANFYKMLSKKLKSLAIEIKNFVNPEFRNDDFFKIFVNSKLNDKLAAYSTGIGYFSNSSLIFIPDKGTSFVLGEIILNYEIESNKLLNSNCDKCSLCISKCPTKALQNNGILIKKKCLQHLSSQKEIPVKIENKYFIDYWENRFFGCTDCVDFCPYNNFKKNKSNEELVGFIGTNFNINEIIDLKKGDYKIRFANNQLSAGWIDEIILVRNALFSAYNQGEISLIKEYQKKINDLNWKESEIQYIEKIYKYFFKM